MDAADLSNESFSAIEAFVTDAMGAAWEFGGDDDAIGSVWLYAAPMADDQVLATAFYARDGQVHDAGVIAGESADTAAKVAAFESEIAAHSKAMFDALRADENTPSRVLATYDAAADEVEVEFDYAADDEPLPSNAGELRAQWYAETLQPPQSEDTDE
jgi:hypothetical protein